MNPTELEKIAAHVRKVAANEGGIHCGVCARDVIGLASVCTQCQAPFHTDCWDYNGGCAVPGCKAAPRDPLRVDLESMKSPPPAPQGRRWLLAVAALAALGISAPYLLGLRAPGPSCHMPPPADSKQTVTRATGQFTIRVGTPPVPGQPAPREVLLETRILVAETAEATAMHLAPGVVPRVLEGIPEAWACLVAAAEKRGTARTVAAPNLVALEGRDLYVCVGKSLMFTGRPEASREAGALELHLRPTAITDAGITLGSGTGSLEVPYDVPQLVHLAARDAAHTPFWTRYELKNAPDQCVAVVVTAHRPKK